MASVNCQLPKTVSSKDRANACKEEFDNKLYRSKVTSNICILKGEQVRTVGTKRLSYLNEKSYKYYKSIHLGIVCLIKHSQLRLER